MDIFDEKSIAPMLIAENKPAFDDPDCIFELKLDGIRALAYLSPDGAELRNKRNKRLNAIYPELRDICKQANACCILDGEIVCINGGSPDFYAVQRRSLMTNPVKIEIASKQLPVSFTAFDILYSDGESLMGLPLMERKAILREIVNDSPALNVSRYVENDGVALYNAAEKANLEGIVAKRKDSKYYPGKRTKDWIKCKHLLDEDFIVCGYYVRGGTAGVIFGSFSEDRAVAYRGHVALGMSRKDFEIITTQPRADKRQYAAFPDFDGAVWIEPALVCTVQYMERTAGGSLRQPVFKGLRDDKALEDCSNGRCGT